MTPWLSYQFPEKRSATRIVDVGSPTPIMAGLAQAASARLHSCHVGSPTPTVSDPMQPTAPLGSFKAGATTTLTPSRQRFMPRRMT